MSKEIKNYGRIKWENGFKIENLGNFRLTVLTFVATRPNKQGLMALAAPKVEKSWEF